MKSKLKQLPFQHSSPELRYHRCRSIFRLPHPVGDTRLQLAKTRALAIGLQGVKCPDPEVPTTHENDFLAIIVSQGSPGGPNRQSRSPCQALHRHVERFEWVLQKSTNLSVWYVPIWLARLPGTMSTMSRSKWSGAFGAEIAEAPLEASLLRVPHGGR